MIFTESTIKISNNVSKMDSTIVLYRGDKNVEIRFTILQSPFKYSNTVATNVIESTNASYGQLVIKTPNDKPPIFSEVSATKEGTVLFTITKEMIDEIEELGVYTFQIRLLDENKQSRVTIPPVENGIEIKEPIAIEDDNSTNVVGLAKANYAVATLSDADTPTFDDNGKYNKTNWNDGDIITNVSLNKIEDGIYTTNENVTATKKYVDDNAVILPLPIHTTLESTSVVINVVNIMDLIPGVQYSTHNNPNETKRQSYRVVYICDDGNFKTICNMPLPNKVVHLLKVLHYTNCSIISVNNTVYNVDYSKHSIVDDVQITNTLQYYLPINNSIEYIPTRDYHPATKKYVDDRFICSDLVENVGTITKEEMQKCNNGTSRYVSSINLKEFFADYKYCAYQGMYGDKKIRMKYDPQYNRVIAYDLDTIDTYDIVLGFEFNTNYMYPFNGGAAQVKSYQFTNDLVITKNIILNPSEVLTKNNTHEYTPTNDYNPATKKYVDDNTPIKSLPVNPTTKTGAVVDVNNLTVSGCYALPKRSDGAHWTNLKMRAMINDGSGKGKSIMLSGYQNFVFHVNVESKKIYCDNLRIVYNIGTTADTTDIRTEPYYLPTTNTKEFTPTKEYHPATKKYVDDNMKTAINGVKGDLGTEELTTTAKNLRGAVNELNAQYKDIVNQNRYCVVTFPGYIFEKITKWNALGDSITEGMSTDKIYHEYIADTYPNLTVRNYGISSTEICTGGTFPNPMCERYVNMDDDADLITVFGGVNDYGHNAPLGSFSVRDNSTFYGGLRTLIEGLLNKYTSKMIYFFTPIKYRGCNNKNTQGKTLEDYVNVVKEVCNYYSVPCVDLYNSNSLNPDIDFINTKYFADGVHPNKDGHLVLARTLTYISDTATDVKVKDITVATGTPIGENIYKQTEYLQNGNGGFWHSDGYFVEAPQYHSAKINIEPGGTYQVLYDNSAFNHVLYITFIKGNTFVKQMEKNLDQTTYRFPNDIDYDAVCICNLDGMDLSKVSIRAISGTGTTPGADSGDTYYSVAYALNNCSSSNSSTSILKGNSYTAIITANSNYTMKSITVTMGGIDITSTAVSGNRISINNITGDIKITATAESSGSDVVSTITPLSATLTPTGNNIYDGSTFKKDGADGFFDSNLQWNPNDTYLSTNISVTPGGKYQILYNGNTVSKNVFITLIKDSTPVKYFDMGLNRSNYQFPNNIDFNICAIVCLDSLDFSKITVKVIP